MAVSAVAWGPLGNPERPGCGWGAIAMAFAAWTLLPLPTAQTQCSVLGWNTHQPSDMHEFVPG